MAKEPTTKTQRTLELLEAAKDPMTQGAIERTLGYTRPEALTEALSYLTQQGLVAVVGETATGKMTLDSALYEVVRDDTDEQAEDLLDEDDFVFEGEEPAEEPAEEEVAS